MLEKIFEYGKIMKKTDAKNNYKDGKMLQKIRCQRKFSQSENWSKRLLIGENILNRKNVKNIGITKIIKLDN